MSDFIRAIVFIGLIYLAVTGVVTLFEVASHISVRFIP